MLDPDEIKEIAVSVHQGEVAFLITEPAEIQRFVEKINGFTYTGQNTPAGAGRVFPYYAAVWFRQTGPPPHGASYGFQLHWGLLLHFLPRSALFHIRVVSELLSNSITKNACKHLLGCLTRRRCLFPPYAGLHGEMTARSLHCAIFENHVLTFQYSSTII